jgi:hypothetical protein
VAGAPQNEELSARFRTASGLSTSGWLRTGRWITRSGTSSGSDRLQTSDQRRSRLW